MASPTLDPVAERLKVRAADRAATAPQQGSVFASDSLPAGYLAHPCDRRAVTGALALTSGTMTFAMIRLLKGMSITKMAAIIATAAASPTHAWGALYTPGGKLLGVTGDTGTGALGATTVLPLTFAAPISITDDGFYLVGLVITAGTMPQIRGQSVNIVPATMPPILAGTSSTGLTDPASAPADAAVLTPIALVPYFPVG